MPLLEHPIVAAIIAGLILAVLIPVGTWLGRKFFRPKICIMTAKEFGPTSREFGFTEPVVKLTIVNKSHKDITIRDIRCLCDPLFIYI